VFAEQDERIERRQGYPPEKVISSLEVEDTQGIINIKATLCQMTENYDIYLYSGLLRFWQSEDWMIIALAANR
jgi:hypothetical protein